MLRFYFKIDPEGLSDEDWAERWNELKYSLTFDSKRLGGETK